jgi:hypothetical protein
MEKSIALNQMCIVMRDGTQIWLEREQAKTVQAMLDKAARSMFLHIGEETINTADIIGIFTPQRLEETTRRHNGQWKCKYGFWHDRNEKCLCKEHLIGQKLIEEQEQKIKKWKEIKPISKEKLEYYKQKFNLSNAPSRQDGFEKIIKTINLPLDIIH